MKTALESLLSYKIGKGLFAWVRKFYLMISDYRIEYVAGDDKSEQLIIYSEELRARPEFLSFLKKISENSRNTGLVYAKRRIYFALTFDLVGRLFAKAEQINLLNVRRLVLFCPHLMFDQALLLRAQKLNLTTICMQHGYYSFNEKEYNLFQDLTRCDVALVYDNKQDDFFKNCKEKVCVGIYGDESHLLAEVVAGTMIFLPYINDANYKYVSELVDRVSYKSQVRTILRVHPRQTEAIVAKKLANPKNEYELIAMQPWIIGEINYYIETTAWIKVRTNCSRVKNYLIRKGECMQLGANEYPSNKRLIQWLNGDYAK